MMSFCDIKIDVNEPGFHIVWLIHLKNNRLMYLHFIHSVYLFILLTNRILLIVNIQTHYELAYQKASA